MESEVWRLKESEPTFTKSEELESKVWRSKESELTFTRSEVSGVGV